MLSRASWRTTAFRLSLVFGAAYVLGVALLLGVVYRQTAEFLNRRVDGILHAEAGLLAAPGPEGLLDRIRQEGARDPLNAFALYTADGQRIAGASRIAPGDLPRSGAAREFQRPGQRGVRALEAPLPWGETLVVSRDISQVVALRDILVHALLASGTVIVILGLVAGSLLGLEPVRRIGAIRLASRRIIAGDLGERLPVSARRDEIDELAAIVNAMLDEVERLVLQAQTSGESVAHELGTPLTRLRAALEDAAGSLPPGEHARGRLESCVREADIVLSRFRALLRIAAVEAKRRRSSIAVCDLSAMLQQVGELYAPLAEERGVRLGLELEPGITARVDPDLFFEALANLLDNALKFTPAGGSAGLSLARTPRGALIRVCDDGPGVSERDLPLITRRFYRALEHHATPGHGLGLSLVAAVLELHGAELSLSNGNPGLRVEVLLPLQDARPGEPGEARRGGR